MGSPPPKRSGVWAWVAALALVAALLWMWRLHTASDALDASGSPDPTASVAQAGSGPPPARLNPLPWQVLHTEEATAARDGGTTLTAAPHDEPATDGGVRASATSKPPRTPGPALSTGRSIVAQIEGRAELEGTPPENAKIDHWSDPRCVMPSNVHDESVKLQDKKLENVVIEASRAEPTKTPPAKSRWSSEASLGPRPLTFAESGCELVPRVQAVLGSAKVEIINRDYTRHVIKLVRAGQTLARAEINPRQNAKDLLVDGVGTVEVSCERHPWERALIVIAPTTSRVAVTHSSGEFHLPSLTPGHWTVKAWHEKFGAQTREVDLVAGETLPLTLAYSVTPPPPPEEAISVPR